MNRQSLANLQKVLAKLYEDDDSIRRIVQDAGLATAAMRINDHALNSWYSVLHEAEKHNQIDQLLRTVATEYPNNQPFHKAYAEYRHTRSGNVVTLPLRSWRPVLLTTLLLVGTGGGWYWNVYHSDPAIATVTPLVVASPSTATPRPQQTPTVILTATPTASATSAPPTATIARAAVATAPSSPSTVTATLVASTTLALYLFDEGLVEHTYLIKGADTVLVAVGTDLVVYHEPNPGTEVAIALLKVISKNPDSLTAQVILIDPETPIRTLMRVDSNLNFLSTGQLVPVFDYVDGYLFRPGRVRLRPERGLVVGDQVQALAFERINGEIIDALRTDTVMQITAIGTSKLVAEVELVTGTWPVTGTIVALVDASIAPSTVVELPTATQELTPTATVPPTLEPTVTPQPMKKVQILVTGYGFAPAKETNVARRKRFALSAAQAMASSEFARWKDGEDVEAVKLVDLGELQTETVRTEVLRTHIPGGKTLEEHYDDTTGEAEVVVEYVVEVPE